MGRGVKFVLLGVPGHGCRRRVPPCGDLRNDHNILYILLILSKEPDSIFDRINRINRISFGNVNRSSKESEEQVNQD